MKKFILIFCAIISTSSAFASNPGVICVASNKMHILIETQKKQVRVSHWGEIVETLQIIKTDAQYLEKIPAIWNTSYDLGQGYFVKTSFPSGSDKGTGSLYINGVEKIKYSSCHKYADIKR